MMLSRRDLLVLAGGGLGALALPARAAAGVVGIAMLGSPRGIRVWFAPQGLAVAAGTRVRWTNSDPGNSHTATAYGPGNHDRLRRIPAGAAVWDSGYLLPEASFEVTLTLPGVYDYYCLPHEMAGMVGRIVVGTPDDPGWQGAAADSDDLLPETLAAFPTVAAILAKGHVDAPQAG